MDTYQLQKSNLVMGNDQPLYVSQTKDVHFDTKGRPGNLDPALAKDLRGHHFKLGSDGNSYQTVSKLDFEPKKGEMAVLN